MPDSSPALAIVVPAYKARFLGATLASIAAQTDRRFNLYVCDDGSPDDLRAIFEQAALGPLATFVRFDDNLGGSSPVKSWARAISVSHEPWIWLFSDDDVMDPGCVSAFYAALSEDGPDAANVYGFNTLIIDQHGKVININPPRPERESVGEFVFHRLKGQSATYAPDHLFRREAYEAHGGFVEFPHAFGSDDASWIVFAGQQRFIRTVLGPRVAWRSSGINISSLWSGTDGAGKLLGLLEFASWILGRADLQPELGPSHQAGFSMDELVRVWFCNLVRRPLHPYSARDIRRLAEASPRIGISRASMKLLLYQVNLQCRVRVVLNVVNKNFGR